MPPGTSTWSLTCDVCDASSLASKVAQRTAEVGQPPQILRGFAGHLLFAAVPDLA